MRLMILIADDDEGICLFVQEYLEIMGYSVITANNGKIALDLLTVNHPHLLITDIMMPQMDGYELVSRLRLRPEYRLLPVIFLTEKASMEERIRGYNLGCDFYLPKPFEVEELGAMVKNLMMRSHTIQSEWRLQVSANIPIYPIKENQHSTQILVKLTQREQEVLELISEGLSNIEIGEKMHLSPRTIEKYVSSLLHKTDSNNRAELVRFALENHLI